MILTKQWKQFQKKNDIDKTLRTGFYYKSIKYLLVERNLHTIQDYFEQI